jgi:hypothetical protein
VTPIRAQVIRLSCVSASSGPLDHHFDVQGQVATSTHAGLPWLLWLRMMFEAKASIHFWPFDGFDVPEGKNLIVEVYPSLFRRRYAKQGRTPDEHDAYCVAASRQDG